VAGVTELKRIFEATASRSIASETPLRSSAPFAPFHALSYIGKDSVTLAPVGSLMTRPSRSDFMLGRSVVGMVSSTSSLPDWRSA
jgi:hypothetical protein